MYETKEDNVPTEKDNSTEEDLNPRLHPSPVPKFSFTSPPDIWQWTAVQNFDFSQQASPKFHFSNPRAIIPESNFSSPVGSTFGSSLVGSTPGAFPVWSAIGSSTVGSEFGYFPVGPRIGSSPIGSTFGSSQVGSTFGSSQVAQTGRFLDVENTASSSGLIGKSNSTFGGAIKPDGSTWHQLTGNQTPVLAPQLVFPSTSTISASKPSHSEVPVVEMIQQNPSIEGNEEEESLKPLPNVIVNVPEVPEIEEIQQNPAIEGNEEANMNVNVPEVPEIEEIQQNPAIEDNETVNGPECAICVGPILTNVERFVCSEGMKVRTRVIQPPCGNSLHLECLNEYLGSFPNPANRPHPICPSCRGNITKRCSMCNKKVKRPAYPCRRYINGRSCPAIYCDAACFTRAQHGLAEH